MSINNSGNSILLYGITVRNTAYTLIFGSSRYPWDYFSKKHTGTAFFNFGMPVLLVFKCFCWPRGIPKRCFEESVCFLPSPESLRAPKTAYQTRVLTFWYALPDYLRYRKDQVRTQNYKLLFVSVFSSVLARKNKLIYGHK